MTVLAGDYVLSPQQQAGDPTAVIVICPQRIVEIPGTGLSPPLRPPFTMKQALERFLVGYSTAIDTIIDTVLSKSLFHEMLHVTIPRSMRRLAPCR
jgi:hypothetical protein